MSSLQIRLAACWFPVTVFGDGKKLAIWFQGCSKRCKECISPEYQEHEGGTEIGVDELFSLFGNIKPDGLVVSGGEPFEQPEALLDLVDKYRKNYNDDILIYTGYTLEELKEADNQLFIEIIEKTAVIIDGKYLPSLNTGMGLAGSSNQKIHIRKFQEKYENAYGWERKMMCVFRKDNSVWMIGVPPLEL